MANKQTVRYAVLLFSVVAAFAFVVVAISGPIYLHEGNRAVGPVGATWLDGWVRFDGSWYLEIARHGYSYSGPHIQSSVAFFPAYPLTMRGIGGVIGDDALAGILLTLVCGLGVAVLFAVWCAERFGNRVARLAIAFLLAYPFAFYLFGSVYADALFIAAMLGAFLLLEHDRPVLAGLVGAVATAARPVGLAVVLGLVVRALEARGALPGSPFTRHPLTAADGVAAAAPPGGSTLVAVPAAQRIAWFPRQLDLRRIRARDAGVLLALAGLIAYCVYLGVRFGQPFAFERVAGAVGWNQAPGPRTWFKYHTGYSLLHPPYTFTDFSTYAQGLLTLGALALVPWVVRRLGWGYGIFTLAVVVVPALSTKDFTGMGRYLLAAFPCFAVLGAVLSERPRRAAAYLAISSSLLALALVLYTRAEYVS